jgi:hypothetical protein
LQAFTEAARKGTVKATEPLTEVPLLLQRQIQYAKKVKTEGIPAAQPPPPFLVKKPKMSKRSKSHVQKFNLIKRYHDGSYSNSAAFTGKAWSCCGETDEHAPGCRVSLSNPKNRLYS